MGEDVPFHGATLRFHFALHALPCVGFLATFRGQSVSYSADTFYDPPRLRVLSESGVLSPGRLKKCATLFARQSCPPILPFRFVFSGLSVPAPLSHGLGP